MRREKKILLLRYSILKIDEMRERMALNIYWETMDLKLVKESVSQFLL